MEFLPIKFCRLSRSAMAIALSGFMVCSFASISEAFAEEFPAQSNIQEEMAKHAFPSDLVIEAKQNELRPQANDALKTAPMPGQLMPNHFASPDFIEPQIKKYDPLDTAKLFEQIKNPKNDAISDLVIFVSFGIPVRILKPLLEQSAEYKAVVVFRGLKDNKLGEKLHFKPTIDAIKKLGLQATPNIQLNPPAFTRFKVEAVPTFVVSNAQVARHVTEDGCAPEVAYASVSGDMSVEYALNVIKQKGKPEFAAIAERYIQDARR